MQTPDSKHDLDPIETVCGAMDSPTAQKRILVLEDSPNTAAITKAFLENAGYHVELAETLRDVRSRLLELAPDMLLLDINVPDGDGLSFLEEVKAGHPEIPAIIFTSEGYNEAKMEEARRKGASGFVSKYMGPSTVLMAIRNVLNCGEFQHHV